MSNSLLLILSMIRLLVVCGWQMMKMHGRFSASVIRASVRTGTSRRRKRSNRLDRYRVECGEWRLIANIRVSGRSSSLSTLSVTRRMAAAGSTSTETTRVETEAPLPDASSLLGQLGNAFEP